MNILVIGSCLIGLIQKKEKKHVYVCCLQKKSVFLCDICWNEMYRSGLVICIKKKFYKIKKKKKKKKKKRCYLQFDKTPRSLSADFVALTRSDGFNHNTCSCCGASGELLCCESCPRSFHLLCVEPPLISLPSSSQWFCPACDEVSKKKTESSTMVI
jgi:hypothetical protein